MSDSQIQTPDQAVTEPAESPVTLRKQRLEAINTQLQARGLKQLRKLGDQTEGEIETTKIVDIYDHSKRFFTDVKFAVIFPGGKEGEFTVRFNANGEVSDGAVIVVLINGRFAIIKQWRVPLGVWTYEVCRGFGDKLDNAQIHGQLGTLKIGDLPIGTLTRELGEEVMATAEISSVTHLGNIAENSGTNAVSPAHFLVQIQVDEARLSDKLKGTEGLKVYLWTADEVDRQFGKRIADNHSITALSLALRHSERLPRRTDNAVS
ncbi:MAG: hypothetical protein SGJ27_17660 [Candidatus Melainabacteria bacterium]|nr:hypothetical protein [Candidatus Melainabacteria bacterium]